MNHRPLIALVFTCVLTASACKTPATDTIEDREADNYVNAMAEEHAGDTPTSNPAPPVADAVEITTAAVVYGNIDGTELAGHLAQPKEGADGAPTIIVIHEWWGLNDQVRGMADQLAKQGYVALAVDLYGKEPATNSDDAMAMMKEAMGQADRLVENLGHASAFLDERSAGKRGVIGWCFGGGWSLQASLAMPDSIDATVIYYGRLVTDEARLSALNNPVLGIFGAEDKGIPVESVKAFETALKNLGKDATIHIYEGANHAFANPSGSAYDQEAAEDAWAKTSAFLAAQLKGE